MLFWRARYVNMSCHDNLNVVVVLSYMLPHIVMPFSSFCVRSVCAFMRVFVHAYESGRNTLMLVIRSFLKV